MPDEAPEVRSIQFTQYTVIVVDEWPPLVAFDHAFLDMPHTTHATVDGDTVTFSVANGTAVYRLLRDRPYGNGVLAELVEGDTPGKLKRAARKYQREEV